MIIYYSSVSLFCCKQSDKEVWRERPFPAGRLKVVSKNVRHMRRLRTVLMERMLSQFTDGVDVYLGVVRDSKDETFREVIITP